MLFNNVGSHGSGEAGNALFKRRFNRLRAAAEELQLPFIPVNSNLDEFYSGLEFQQTHTPRNASAALLLQNGLGKMIYASTYGYADVKVSPTYDSAYADPVTLPLLGTEALEIMPGDTNLSRVEKTISMAKLPLSHRYLDVCVVEGAKNCSRCWKCMRTLFTLDIAGKLSMFTDVFDIPTYMKWRKDYLLEVAASEDPLLREVAAFAEQHAVHMPKFRGAIIGYKSKFSQAIRKLKKST